MLCTRKRKHNRSIGKMKHILKKFHFGGGGGGNHESSASASSGRSNELLATAAPSGSSSSPLTSPSFSSSAPTLTSAPNTASSMLDPSSSTIGLPSSVSTLPTSAADSDAVSSAIRAQMVAADYFSSEEEFQVQLAMAISASDSELLEDPHNHQIRAATLLSLGKHHHDRSRKAVDTTAGSLSRRYWVSDLLLLRLCLFFFMFFGIWTRYAYWFLLFEIASFFSFSFE